MRRLRSALILVAGLGAGLVAAGAAASGWLSWHADQVLWLGGGPGRWIVAPIPASLRARHAAELETRFERVFEQESGGSTLRVRALGRATVTVNGRVVAGPDSFPRSWKQTLTLDVSDALRPGANSLRVSVLRSESPAALNAALGSLRTDESWSVSIAGSSWRPARFATRQAILDPVLPDLLAARPLAALAASLPLLGGFGLLWGLIAIGLARCPEAWKRRLPVLATGGALLAWAALYANNAGRLLANTGFDAQFHLDYVRQIVQDASLPLAHQGWEMYQPPLFYAVCAALAVAVGGGAVHAPLLRAVTFGAGMTQILLLGGIARLLWPQRPTAYALAVGFGAFLPMHLYLFQFVSNETLAMALSTGVSFLTLRMLVREEAPSLRGCLGVGVWLGLALLAKFSALVLAPPVLGAVGFAFLRAGSERRTTAAGLLALLGSCAAVCGWHFVRVWGALGNPFIGNWDASLGFDWWQHPGYRTIADYSFGRALVAPWFSGIGPVPDGVWSTLWGDALTSGAMQGLYGAPWNYRLMSAGYALSVVPAGLALVGAGVGASRLLRGRLEASRRAVAVYLAALAAFVLGSLLFMTLRVPSYGVAKAFYLQPALPTLTVAFVVGTSWVAERAGRFRAVPLVLLAICASTFYASVWVRPAAPSTQVQRGWLALTGREPAKAEAHFHKALRVEPDQGAALAGLAVAQADRKRWAEAAEAAHRALGVVDPDEQPGLAARALGAASQAALALGRPDDAERALRRAIELDPDEPSNYRQLVRLLLRQQRPRAAAHVLRDLLWITPNDPEIQRRLTRTSG